MTPTVGDIVHFYALYETEPRAAIIIAVGNREGPTWYVDLHVFPGVSGADQIKRDVPFAYEPKAANCWDWRG